MMVRLWLYAFCRGIRSSRQLERATVEDVPCRFLAGNQRPDFCTLSKFRKRHHKALGQLFFQTVRLAKAAGLVEMGHVSLDGTKVQANASKHKAMSYSRLVPEEQRLQQEIEAFMAEAAKTDGAEDREFGPDKRGDELPEELRHSARRLEKIRQAKKALEDEAKERLERDQEERRAQAAEENREYHPRKSPDDAKPEPTAQRNFTDPESRIMRNSDKAYTQAYNAQAAVDADSHIIVAASTSNIAADAPHLPSILAQIKSTTGAVPKEMSADAGYWSESNLEALAAANVEAYIPPGRIRHTEWRTQLVVSGPMPDGLTPADQMRWKLRTETGRARYGLRMQTVEPIFGQAKQSRNFRQFLLRGQDLAGAEWLLQCAAHNLLRLFKHRLGLR